MAEQRRTYGTHAARVALVLACLVVGVVLLSAERLTLALVVVGLGALLATYARWSDGWQTQRCFDEHPLRHP